jgi:hypothetical protein
MVMFDSTYLGDFDNIIVRDVQEELSAFCIQLVHKACGDDMAVDLCPFASFIVSFQITLRFF